MLDKENSPWGVRALVFSLYIKTWEAVSDLILQSIRFILCNNKRSSSDLIPSLHSVIQRQQKLYQQKNPAIVYSQILKERF